MLQNEVEDEPVPPLKKRLLDLPNELIIDILACLTKLDLKIVRLVNSHLREVSTPLVFTTVTVAARRRIFDTFVALSNNANLCRHVVEFIYDSSWFTLEAAEKYRNAQGPSLKFTSPESGEKYIQAFDEQEQILADELAPALRKALPNFTQLRRVIYADFARLPCFHWDSAEELGLGSALPLLEQPMEKIKTTSFDSPLFFALWTDLSLRQKHLGLALLLGALSQPDCKAEITDLRLGDCTYSRSTNGIPDALLMALSDKSYGPSSALQSLRKLDITVSECTSVGKSDCRFPDFPHLNLFRLIGPMCSPNKKEFAPPLREPSIQFPDYCERTYWPKLRALELKWVMVKTQAFLDFLSRHKDMLHFINLYEIYVCEKSTWGVIVSALHSMYPGLIVEPFHRFHHFPSFDTLIFDFTFYDGQAILTNTGVVHGLDQSLDDYDEEDVSVYDINEDLGSESSYSSEEFDSSMDGDYDGPQEYQGLLDPL
ncbi:MAG: hypothetical protein Q9219_001311 [cf. Caloplaca sp. 3 TL-2023]